MSGQARREGSNTMKDDLNETDRAYVATDLVAIYEREPAAK